MKSLAVVLALAIAQSPVDAEKDAKFKPLFNGKDLTGWVTPDNKGLFSVEDGEILGRTKKGELKKNEFLATEKAYGDFVLKVKFKYKNGNSGIQFRSARASDGVVSGPQADIVDGHWGLLYEENRRGIVQEMPNAEAKALVKDGEWNEFEITARGDHVTMKLNGTTTVDRTDPNFEKKGIIALQLHVGPPMEIRFKDIEIKPLAD